jgi:hypothetical protein
MDSYVETIFLRQFAVRLLEKWSGEADRQAAHRVKTESRETVAGSSDPVAARP